MPPALPARLGRCRRPPRGRRRARRRRSSESSRKPGSESGAIRCSTVVLPRVVGGGPESAVAGSSTAVATATLTVAPDRRPRPLPRPIIPNPAREASDAPGQVRRLAAATDVVRTRLVLAALGLERGSRRLVRRLRRWRALLRRLTIARRGADHDRDPASGEHALRRRSPARRRAQARPRPSRSGRCTAGGVVDDRDDDQHERRPSRSRPRRGRQSPGRFSGRRCHRRPAATPLSRGRRARCRRSRTRSRR